MAEVKKVVIVGGVAGGMSAATRLRRLDESVEIVVIERGEHVSFANCGLPYVVGGVIPGRDDVLPHTPESLRRRFNLDVRTGQEALSIDPDGRVVEVRDLHGGGTYREPYDELVLSTGARPIVPDVPGIERAHTLRDIPDMDGLLKDLDAGAHSAVVVGGGFIGLETTENLVRRGLDVTLVEASAQVLGHLDVEMARPVERELRRNGVRLMLETAVTGVDGAGVALPDGSRVAADVVVLAIGVTPESELAAEAGAELGARRAIVVDERQRTSLPHVFAVGDAVVKRDRRGGELLAPLANTANRQGRLVADVIAGRDAGLRPTLGTAVLRVFDVVVASSGRSEAQLRRAGADPRVVHTHPASHAGYYPGAQPMSLKLCVDPDDDAILGVQGIGGEGVDKRIDVVATAMSAGVTASGLADLELAYAPQFGSAKDPVNMLGFIAENLRDGVAGTVQWHALDAAVAAGAQLVDVRTAGEHAANRIPGAVNIPVDELRDRIGEIGREAIVHCAVGQRGHTAARILAGHGVRVRNLDGGIRTWLAVFPEKDD
ncbi:FAD-dependent oxidoreductase [Actinomadura sp. 1N219]|uniref:FAD-dependent oxidoreductase n=1 Tax=Actinomadura sp. 1N219 TaxID=3375152 RepID=UPI0037A32161